MSQQRVHLDGSYRHLDQLVVACLRGNQDPETSVRVILDSHAPGQVKAVLFNAGERYRRLSRARFRDLVEQLRLRGVLW